MEAEELAARVRETLRDTSAPLWIPELTLEFVDTAWRKLGRDLGITRASYGTTRVLCQDPGEERRVPASLDVSSLDRAGHTSISVEVLPEAVALRCAGRGVRFFATEEVLKPCVAGCVMEALGILGSVPTLLPTVCALVRALHLIDPADDEVDVSFSDPTLPFSAFISVPGPGAVARVLRVAEALLHEAMHLQLTLVETVVPLITPSELEYFSPWRNEYRTAQGVLHALYVFQVIDAFLSATRFEGSEFVQSEVHARKRRATIAQQVQASHKFRECRDLTPDGVAFVARLLG
jgi:hypothetical protein